VLELGVEAQRLEVVRSLLEHRRDIELGCTQITELGEDLGTAESAYWIERRLRDRNGTHDAMIPELRVSGEKCRRGG
jgi:hypothetical protein